MPSLWPLPPLPRPTRSPCPAADSATETAGSAGSAGTRGTGRRWTALAAAAALVAGTLAVLLPSPAAQAATGGYTTTPVGPLPSGCGDISTNPREWVTADAPAGAVPTNDWWTSILWKKTNCAYGEPLMAHPLGFRAQATGLGFSYTTTPAISGSAGGVGEYHFPYAEDFVAGVTGLDAPAVKVDGWSDWTVSPYLSDGAHTLRATIGEGLPFAYFRVTGGSARITPAAGATAMVWRNTGSTLGFTLNGHDYVAFAPTGAVWTADGAAFTSTLAGKDYFSVAVLPTTASTSAADRSALADGFAPYAYHFVEGTQVSYRYDEATATVHTHYGYTTRAMEGGGTGVVTALLPHQWRYLAGAAPLPQTYVSARGPLKILAGVTGFDTAMPFHGVLPEVPAVADSNGADLATLRQYLAAEKADPLHTTADDTYWTGKGLGRAARLAEIADQVGETDVRDAALSAIEAKLTDWFTAAPGKTAHTFYYDRNWGTLIGYPASYGSDQELNDHHFHYGYFIAAAATLAKFHPEWASAEQYGGMVDLLIRDADNYDRSDTRFPYLRDFDIYDGHDWASGHGSFFAGNNQESSSEGMNFDNALIQWGETTGNTAVRDAGIFLYTTQAAAIADYWFGGDQVYPAAFPHHQVGMVWGDGGAYSTWFSANPAQVQGINLLPITGGSLYLGTDPATVLGGYQDLMTATNGAGPSVWQDIWDEYLALGDGSRALTAFRADSGRPSEEGESRAHTFHWVDNLATLGRFDADVTADHPLAATFSDNGALTYVAANVTAAPLTVRFSDGKSLEVPAGRTVAAGAHPWSGGSASGGVDPSSPTPSPSDSSSPSPSPSESPSPSPSESPSPSTGGPSSPTLYPRADGSLQATSGSAGGVSIPAADGNHDGTPSHPLVWTATGLHLTRAGGTPTFHLAVDAGTAVGNGTQLRLSYDCTGDGSWDRTETYRYFATDPVPGDESYTEATGLLATTGTPCDLAGGTVRAEVWNAIGSQPTTLDLGATSAITLAYR